MSQRLTRPREARECGSLQYQKNLRLLEAQRLLRNGTVSVTTVAVRGGLRKPHQFSREHSRKFGRPPKNDLAKTGTQAVAEARAVRFGASARSLRHRIRRGPIAFRVKKSRDTRKACHLVATDTASCVFRRASRP